MSCWWDWLVRKPASQSVWLSSQQEAMLYWAANITPPKRETMTPPMTDNGYNITHEEKEKFKYIFKYKIKLVSYRIIMFVANGYSPVQHIVYYLYKIKLMIYRVIMFVLLQCNTRGVSHFFLWKWLTLMLYPSNFILQAKSVHWASWLIRTRSQCSRGLF